MEENVATLMSIANCTRDAATVCLNASGGNLEAAISYYYDVMAQARSISLSPEIAVLAAQLGAQGNNQRMTDYAEALLNRDLNGNRQTDNRDELILPPPPPDQSSTGQADPVASHNSHKIEEIEDIPIYQTAKSRNLSAINLSISIPSKPTTTEGFAVEIPNSQLDQALEAPFSFPKVTTKHVSICLWKNGLSIDGSFLPSDSADYAEALSSIESGSVPSLLRANSLFDVEISSRPGDIYTG